MTIDDTNHSVSSSMLLQYNTAGYKSQNSFARKLKLPPTIMQESRTSSNIARHSIVAVRITPSPNDILFGRGKRFQNHPGNLRMRKIIRKYKNIYSAQKGQHRKRLVVENAYNEIIHGGARFVKQSDGKDEWVEVVMHEALEKVAHTIRYKPRNRKEGATGRAEDEEEDQSVDDRLLTMAANTVFLSNDDTVTAQNHAPPVDPSPSHAVLGNHRLGSHTLNQLLNPRMSLVGINQIVPPVSLLDVYVNPMNRQALLSNYFSSNHPPNLLWGGLGVRNHFALNPGAPNADLMAALWMGDGRSQGTIADATAYPTNREEQEAASEKLKDPSPSRKKDR
jgi:hypothetical protein